jgi:hypothetical protein
MQRALDKGADIYGRYIFDHRSALHYAAQCQGKAGPGAVRWLLNKGIPWSAGDSENEFAEDVARNWKNEESWRVLRDWAVNQGKSSMFLLCVEDSYSFAQSTSFITGLTGNRTTQIGASPSISSSSTKLMTTRAGARRPLITENPQVLPTARSP